MQWVEERVPKNENEEFLSVLEKKLYTLEKKKLAKFINNITSEMATDKIITAHHHTNQTKWNIYSYIIINDLANNLHKEKQNLMDIIKNLGSERHYIALDLEHNKPSVRNEYGLLRGIDTSKTEICYEKIQRENTPFSYLFLPISKYIDKLIKNNFLERHGKNSIMEFINKDTVAVKTLEADLYNHTVYATENLPSSSEDICILVRKNKKNEETERIAITYPKIADNSIDQRIEKLQPLFENLMRDNPHDDLNSFMEKLGELSYHLYRMLPLRRGTAAVVDWLIRAIAESKQVELGHRKDNDLPPDFMAFLTVRTDQYANWFANNAFTEIKLQKNLKYSVNSEVKASMMGFFLNPLSSKLIKKLNDTEEKRQIIPLIEKIMDKVASELRTTLHDQLDNIKGNTQISKEEKKIWKNKLEEEFKNELKNKKLTIKKELEQLSLNDIKELANHVDQNQKILPYLQKAPSSSTASKLHYQ